eukprot:scaffold64459_cov58-Phaeocystis_antarctica.AAC.5
MTWTACATEPSGPRSASPGPRMESCMALTRAPISSNIAMQIERSQVAWMASLESELMSTSVMAPKAKPARSAACPSELELVLEVCLVCLQHWPTLISGSAYGKQAARRFCEWKLAEGGQGATRGGVTRRMYSCFSTRTPLPAHSLTHYRCFEDSSHSRLPRRYCVPSVRTMLGACLMGMPYLSR